MSRVVRALLWYSSLACLGAFALACSGLKNFPEDSKLQSNVLIDNNLALRLNFAPLKLAQGCDAGDLPFHFFSHPDKKTDTNIRNPGIVTGRDFVIWAGLGFPVLKPEFTIISSPKNPKSEPRSWDNFPTISDSKNHLKNTQLSNQDGLSPGTEELGLKFVIDKAEQGLPGYQTILANYLVYFKNNTKNGLYWAERAAEAAETGSMVILGDAYISAMGVVADNVQGLKWYILGSCLGDTAAQGRLFARAFSTQTVEDKAAYKRALEMAREWMNSHRHYFISKDNESNNNSHASKL